MSVTELPVRPDSLPVKGGRVKTKGISYQAAEAIQEYIKFCGTPVNGIADSSVRIETAHRGAAGRMKSTDLSETGVRARAESSQVRRTEASVRGGQAISGRKGGKSSRAEGSVNAVAIVLLWGVWIEWKGLGITCAFGS